MANDDRSMAQAANDLSLLVPLLADIKDKVREAGLVVDDIASKFHSPFAEKGVSFLDMKYHVLLQYLIDLNLLMARKVAGKKIEGHPVVDRLVESRTVLEKTRSIDVKLKYIINKYLKASTKSISDIALSYRPNPDNLVGNVDNKDEDDDKTDKEENNEVYVPPKVTAMPYEDFTTQNRKAKLLERSRKRALNSSLLQDLRNEYSEQPEEILEGFRRNKRAKIRMLEETREKYEEENLIRLPTTRKERQMMNSRNSGLGELTHFDPKSLRAFHADADDEMEEFTRKKDFKNKGKKRKGFKGRRGRKSR